MRALIFFIVTIQNAPYFVIANVIEHLLVNFLIPG